MPTLHASVRQGISCITAKHHSLGKTHLYCLQSPPAVGPTSSCEIDDELDAVEPELLFTENNTNYARLYGGHNDSPYVKDAFHDHIIPLHRPPFVESENSFDTGKNNREKKSLRPQVTAPAAINGKEINLIGTEGPTNGPHTTVRPTPTFINLDRTGTKSAAHYTFKDVPGLGGCAVVRLKLTPQSPSKDPSIEDEGLFDDAIEERRQEADEFYNSLVFGPVSDDLKQIMRQALGGMLWTKQYYQFIQRDWLKGDPAQPPPPPERQHIRNKARKYALHSDGSKRFVSPQEWRHMHIADVLSMPDK